MSITTAGWMRERIDEQFDLYIRDRVTKEEYLEAMADLVAEARCEALAEVQTKEEDRWLWRREDLVEAMVADAKIETLSKVRSLIPEGTKITRELDLIEEIDRLSSLGGDDYKTLSTES